MNRAVVVLLLLIANVIVSVRKAEPPAPAPPPRADYSLGLFTIVDGGALRTAPESDECPLERMRREHAAPPVAFDDIRL